LHYFTYRNASYNRLYETVTLNHHRCINRVSVSYRPGWCCSPPPNNDIPAAYTLMTQHHLMLSVPNDSAACRV